MKQVEASGPFQAVRIRNHSHDTPTIACLLTHSCYLSGNFQIITFDIKGVSGHANHRACFHAIQHLSHSSSLLTSNTSLFVLHTLPVHLKFLSLPLALVRHAMPSSSVKRQGRQQIRFLSNFKEYLRARSAMTAHQSQLVWFRYLYIIMSAYMYNNELRQL